MSSSEEVNDLREQAYRINETIIIFIGIAMFWMPPLTGIFGGSVTKEFILGATFASFFLAFSDGILISGTATKSNLIWYGSSFVSGILSIIYLPVLLSMYPNLLERLDPMSTDITLMALGFVLIVVGYRSFTHKSKAISDVRTELDVLLIKTKETLII